jgi:hypothetical protein
MSDPRVLSDEHLYKQRACQSLLAHSGWRTVVLPLVAERLAQTEQMAAQTALAESVRLGAVDERHALLWLIKTVYRLADEPNPFDAARLALWSTLAPPREPVHTPASETPTWADEKARMRARSGGSVA